MIAAAKLEHTWFLLPLKHLLDPSVISKFAHSFTIRSINVTLQQILNVRSRDIILRIRFIVSVWIFFCLTGAILFTAINVLQTADRG